MDKLLALAASAIVLLLFSLSAPARIYECMDAKGHAVFSDRRSACAQPQSNGNPAPEPSIPVAKAEKPKPRADAAKAEPAEDQAPPVTTPPKRPGGEFKEKLGVVLLAVGAIISLVYSVALLIVTFRVSVWWGLGSLFVPLVGLLFVVMHWEEAKNPFLKSFFAIPFIVLGILLNPAMFEDNEDGNRYPPAQASPPAANKPQAHD